MKPTNDIWTLQDEACMNLPSTLLDSWKGKGLLPGLQPLPRPAEGCRDADISSNQNIWLHSWILDLQDTNTTLPVYSEGKRIQAPCLSTGHHTPENPPHVQITTEGDSKAMKLIFQPVEFEVQWRHDTKSTQSSPDGQQPHQGAGLLCLRVSHG